MIFGDYLLTGLITAGVVVIAVMLHYEGLRILSDRLMTVGNHFGRRRIVMLILALLLLHVVEVWIFGIAYYVLLQFDGFGALHGETSMAFFDCIYYSAAVYTTVGFGDIYPVGAIRLMTGTEAITGLTMITWSASYTFVEMLNTWSKDD